ncbi:MAG: homoserine dehydrogenase [Candidatus Methanofastidiosia archaeon]
MKKLRIAVIGLGVVGTGFLTLLDEKKEVLEGKYGLTYDVVAVCDKMRGSIYNPDGVDISLILKESPMADGLEGTRGLSSFDIIEKPEVDVVVEATPTNLKTGGVGLEHARRALGAGKHFISTNKAPPAIAYKELTDIAKNNNVYYGFEGTILSGTPAISLAMHGLPASEFKSIRGVLNGTTNFILERMENDGMDFDEALLLAQSKGYAEADPSSDIDGWDACAKVVIMANNMLDTDMTPDDVEVRGLRNINLSDVEAAKKKKMRIKMVGSLTRKDNGDLKACVVPELVDRSDPLYHVHGVTNALVFDTDTTDTVTVMGPGAGGRSAGYAMLYDLVEMHRHRKRLY